MGLVAPRRALLLWWALVALFGYPTQADTDELTEADTPQLEFCFMHIPYGDTRLNYNSACPPPTALRLPAFPVPQCVYSATG